MPPTDFAANTVAPAESDSFLALGLYVGAVVLLVAVLLLLASRLGRKTRGEVKGQAYESGIRPSGKAQLDQPVPFYLVAIFFIVFDVEAIFILSWAVAYDLLGWAGFVQIAVFVGVMFLGLIYLWKAGALDWGPSRARQAGAKTGSWKCE